MSSAQKLALDNGQPVPIVVDQTECVIVRRDIFEQSKDLPVEESYSVVLEAWDAEGNSNDGDAYRQ